MRYAASSLGLLLGVALGTGACFDDPTSTDGSDCPVGEEGCSCLANATCFGTLECVQGVCLSGTGETVGDGDGDGDGETGDGDGDPGENVVLDLFTDACAVTTAWSTLYSTNPVPIECDLQTGSGTGWMVRYPELTIGDETFTKVISLVTADLLAAEIRGLYNVDDIPDPSTLEFRAEVLLRCAQGDTQCIGRFGLAVAEGVPNGLYQVIDDRDLVSGEAPVSVATNLGALITLSEPSVGLVARRTDDSADPSPEVLIINPRLVLP
jgi:hypothetical protein